MDTTKKVKFMRRTNNGWEQLEIIPQHVIQGVTTLSATGQIYPTQLPEGIPYTGTIISNNTILNGKIEANPHLSFQSFDHIWKPTKPIPKEKSQSSEEILQEILAPK